MHPDKLPLHKITLNRLVHADRDVRLPHTKVEFTIIEDEVERDIRVMFREFANSGCQPS